MGNQHPPVLLQSAILLCIVLLSAATAIAQEPTAKSAAPLDSAFKGFERSWIVGRVPAWKPSGQVASTQGVYSRAYSGTRRVEAEAMGSDDKSFSFLPTRKNQASNQWILAQRPVDGFANGFDAFGNPAIGPVDIQAQARTYLKQRLISEVLSKTAFGRSLSLFIDSGDHRTLDKRSMLIPYVSPKLNASAGKASVSLIWKF